MSSFFYQQSLSLSTSWKREKQYQFLKNKYNDLKQDSDSKKEIGLLYALMTGDKSKLDKKNKKDFKELGLMHLLTPSGLHFSSLIIFFKFFPKKVSVFLVIFFSLPFFWLEKYYSIKRVITFKVTYILLGNKIENKSYIAFIFTFLVDILFGNFSDSPLSFTYSFLFWGTIIFHKGSFLDLNYKLFTNLVLTNFISVQPVSIISILINSPLSLIFSFIYPILCFNFWINLFNFQTKFSLWIIKYFINTIEVFNNYSAKIYPNLMFIILILIIIGNLKFKKISILIFGTLLSFNLGNITKYSISNKKYILSPVRNKNCDWTLKEYYYEIKCKKKALKRAL